MASVASPPAPPKASSTADRPVGRMPRAVVLASIAGGLAGFVVVALIVVTTQAWARHYSDDFFDAQAHAWLGGHWDVPANVVGGEGFTTPTGMQMYFGIAPALVRLPIAVLGSSLDGRTSLISELVALAVLALATARFGWAVRTRLTDAAVGRADLAMAGLLVALVAGASTGTFLAGQPTVFTEAILWSATLLLLTMDQVLRLLAEPSRRRAIVAAVFAGIALNTRITTGLGAALIVGLVVLLAWRGKGRWARLRPGAVAAAVILGASLLVCLGANTARFGHPWKVAYEDQSIFRFDAERLARYQAAGGQFSPGYLQTDLAAYLRPDGARLGPGPFVSFPDPHDTVVGSLPPSVVEPTASVPLAMPGLTLLAAIGIAVLVRGRDRHRLRDLALPLLGAAVPIVFLVTFMSLAHRYTGDFLPALIALASVGAAWACRRPARAVRLALLGSVGLLALWGAWVTLNLAGYTNERNSLRSRPTLEAWASTIAAVAHRGGGLPQPASPPGTSAGWDLIARPDCARVYTAYFDKWYAFERAPGTGAYHVRVQPPPDDGRVHVLATSDGGDVQVGLRRKGDGAVVAYSTDGGRTWTETSTVRGMRSDGSREPQVVPVGEDGRVDLVVDFDSYTKRLTVSGDTTETTLLVQLPLEGAATGSSLAPDYPGGVVTVDDPPARCAEWTRTG